MQKLTSNHEVKYRQKDYKYWIKIDISKKMKKFIKDINYSKKIDIENGYKENKEFIKHYSEVLANQTRGEKNRFIAQAHQRLGIIVKGGELLYIDDRTKREYYLYQITKPEINIDEHHYGFGTNMNMQFKGKMIDVLKSFAQGKKYEPKDIDNKLVEKLNFKEIFRAEPIHTQGDEITNMIMGKHETEDILTIINYILPIDKKFAPIISHFNIPLKVAKIVIEKYENMENQWIKKAAKLAKKAVKKMPYGSKAKASVGTHSNATMHIAGDEKDLKEFLKEVSNIKNKKGDK